MNQRNPDIISIDDIRDAVQHAEPVTHVRPNDPQNSNTEDAWPELVPIGYFDPPDFPVEVLPVGLRRFCEAVSESLQVPVDLPAMLILAAGATIFAKRLRVRIDADWDEPVNLYVCVALPPGERKSAVFSQVFKPVERYEIEMVNALSPEVGDNHNVRAIAEAKLKKARHDAATLPKPEAREAAKLLVGEASRELQDTPILCLPKIIVDDLTPEKIPGMLAEQRGRLAILSPEGDVFGDMAGRYSRTPKLGPYLKGHAGDDIRVDRVSKDRPSEHIVEPALTIGLCVQPGVVAGLSKHSGFDDCGLTARFLYSMPRSRVGYREVNQPPIPRSVQLAYEAAIDQALRYGHPCNLTPEIPVDVVALTPEAQGLREQFSQRVENDLQPGRQLALISGWGGKLVGAVCRIAAIIHGFNNGGPGRPPTIDTETMAGAIKIGEYLIEHARGAFALMGADPDLVRARKLAGWIKEKGLTEFSKRDAFNIARNRNDKVDIVEAPLELLRVQGYIRPRRATIDPSIPGRKPSPRFDVSREICAHNMHNGQSG